MGRNGATRLVVMCLVLCGAAGVSALLGERVPLHQGLGFDAFSIYLPITKHLPEYVAQGKIDSYTIQRLLPFVFAHYTLRALGLPLQAPFIIGFFEVYNLVVLSLAVWVWLLLARRCHLSVAGEWLGFIGLFVSFPVMKLPFYYPVNLDTSALLVGLATLYYYKRNSVLGVLLVCLAGAFIWPTTVVVASLLLVLPSELRWPERPGLSPALVTTLLLLFSISVALAFGYALVVVGVRAHHGGAQTVRSLLPLSLTAVAAYLFFALRALIAPFSLGARELRLALLTARPAARFAALTTLWAVHLLATRILASPGPPLVSAGDYALYLALAAAARPAQFLVCHVVYWGPVLLLMLLRWPGVARHVRSHGVGLTCVTAFALLQGLDCESRHLINLLSFLVLPAVLSAEETPLSGGLLGTIAAFAALLSRCWLPINRAAAALGRVDSSFPLGAGNFLKFPAQIYFMNFGPWTSNSMLALQVAVVTAMAIFLYLRYLRHESKPTR